MSMKDKCFLGKMACSKSCTPGLFLIYWLFTNFFQSVIFIQLSSFGEVGHRCRFPRVEASSFPCQSSQWANSLRKTKGEDGRRLKWPKHMPCSPCSPAAIFRSLELSLCEARSYNQTSSHKDIIASAQHGAADHATVAHSVEILNNILNIVQ